jgi:hypothetical protein
MYIQATAGGSKKDTSQGLSDIQQISSDTPAAKVAG